MIGNPWSPPAAEIKQAFRAVWLLLSVILLGVLLVPWILSPAQIALITPKCEWKQRYGKECLLCGMTTGFIAIAHGRYREAERSNRGSLPLYAGFAGNETVAAAWLVWKLRSGNAQLPC